MHKISNENKLTKMVKGGVPCQMMSAQAGNIGVLMEWHDENQEIQPRWRFIIGTVGIAQAMGMLTHPV